MNKKICILTDTSSTFTEASAQACGVRLMALNMIDAQSVEHFNNLSMATIKDRMLAGEVFKTSSTPLGVILNLVTNLLKTYDQVIYFTVSAKISSQFSQVNLLLDDLNPDRSAPPRFFVFDSRTAGYTLELLARFFAQLNNDNQLDVTAIPAMIEAFNASCFNYFICRDVKYIARSGRGGKKILKYLSKIIYPVIHFGDENNLESISYTFKSAIEKMIAAVVKRAQKFEDAVVDKLVVYYGCGDEATLNAIVAKLVERLNFARASVKIIDVPKVVFVHTGPETYGVSVKMKKI